MVKAEQRRQIKNALMWLRETVRQPLHLNVNRFVCHEIVPQRDLHAMD